MRGSAAGPGTELLKIQGILLEGGFDEGIIPVFQKWAFARLFSAGAQAGRLQFQEEEPA
jgi:hypothetical protein